jgi:hypothetical protein
MIRCSVDARCNLSASPYSTDWRPLEHQGLIALILGHYIIIDFCQALIFSYHQDIGPKVIKDYVDDILRLFCAVG